MAKDRAVLAQMLFMVTNGADFDLLPQISQKNYKNKKIGK